MHARLVALLPLLIAVLTYALALHAAAGPCMPEPIGC